MLNDFQANGFLVSLGGAVDRSHATDFTVVGGWQETNELYLLVEEH